MPGFEMTWRLQKKGRQKEERDQQIEVKKVGRRVESPDWDKKCKDSWKMQSHTYKASLWMDQAVEMMDENDTLVVEVESVQGDGKLVAGKGEKRLSHTLPSERFALSEKIF